MISHSNEQTLSGTALHHRDTLELTTSDNTGLVLHHLGGCRNPRALLVVHATSFSANVYRSLASKLTNEFDVYGVDLRAHGRSQARTDETFQWNHFALDIQAALGYVSSLTYESIYGFGHSLGGASILLGLQDRLFDLSGTYLFEPIIFPNLQESDPDPHNVLALSARRRKERFPSKMAAFENFSKKIPMRNFEFEPLADYVSSCFEETPSGEVTLSCNRNSEAAIYEHGSAHACYKNLHLVSTPTVIATGSNSDTFSPQYYREVTDKLPHGRLDVVKNVGHFAPMTHTDIIANSIRAALNETN